MKLHKLKFQQKNIKLLLALPLLGGLFLFLFYFFYKKFREPPPVLRGYLVAVKSGCFNCHGDKGKGGVKNFGSKYKEVPAWDGGTLMMFVKNDKEIEEYILYGKPLRKLRDTLNKQKRKKALLHMPAYKGRISKRDLKALLSYINIIGNFEEPEDPLAKKGLEVAKKLECFRCHGPYGIGGSLNPGSFKGYIPGWEGKDFEELVKDERELEEWILKGKNSRLERNIIARFFIRRQAIKMPAYEKFISPEELKALKAYIKWLRSKY